MEKAITAADDGSDYGSTLCEYAINAIGQEREFSRPGGVTQRLALVVLSLFDNEFTLIDTTNFSTLEFFTPKMKEFPPKSKKFTLPFI